LKAKKKVCLKEFGSYVKNNNKCLHRGYKRGSVKTYLTAQIFSAQRGTRSTVKNSVAKFEEGVINEDNLPVLKSINEDILQGWEEKYKCKKYKASTWFQSCKVNQKKTCRIDQKCFSDMGLDKVKQLINIFETIYPKTIRVTKVWFLKKRKLNDGFERFHYDYNSINGGHNAVSSTIVVNLGVCVFLTSGYDWVTVSA
jgi:hypothetical protein